MKQRSWLLSIHFAQTCLPNYRVNEAPQVAAYTMATNYSSVFNTSPLSAPQNFEQHSFCQRLSREKLFLSIVGLICDHPVSATATSVVYSVRPSIISSPTKPIPLISSNAYTPEQVSLGVQNSERSVFFLDVFPATVVEAKIVSVGILFFPPSDHC